MGGPASSGRFQKTEVPRGEEKFDLSDMQVPTRLKRAQLWIHHSTKPQLEFIVDNLTLAELMNIEASITNPFYDVVVNRMRSKVHHMYRSTFEYKGGFLNPHEWRAT